MKPCGTEAAHRRHRRNGEPPCEMCKDAHNQRKRDTYQRAIEDCPTCEDVAFLARVHAPAPEAPDRIGMSKRELIEHLTEHRKPALCEYVADVYVPPGEPDEWADDYVMDLAAWAD